MRFPPRPPLVPTLTVNVDHVATLREARKGQEPDPVLAAHLALLAGAQGITVHLREDRRHIQDRDVRRIREQVPADLNLEMAATPEMRAIAREIRPAWATIVPERRQELTTEGGLNVAGHINTLKRFVDTLHEADIRVSLFIDPDADQIAASQDVGADAVELHTGRYADAPEAARADAELVTIMEAAKAAQGRGFAIHAGHGLTYRNVQRVAAIPEVEELAIGHSIVSRAVIIGLEWAVREMITLIREARRG